MRRRNEYPQRLKGCQRLAHLSVSSYLIEVSCWIEVSLAGFSRDSSLFSIPIGGRMNCSMVPRV